MVIRKPIKIPRKPIKLSVREVSYFRLREIQMSAKKSSIWRIVHFYESMVAQYLSRSYFRCIPKDVDAYSHPNWSHFECIWELCRIQEWDWKMYIEVQFKRVNKRVSASSYPKPSHLYTLKALQYFTDYLAKLKRDSQHDIYAHKYTKSKRADTLDGEIRRQLDTSVRTIHRYLKDAQEDADKAKALHIFHLQNTLSPYYLWGVPWFHDILKGMEDSNHKRQCVEAFSLIQQSSRLQVFIASTVKEMEESLGIPGNITL